MRYYDHMADRPPWQDRETFQQLYLTEGKTQRELAKLWDCSLPTVATWATRHGLSKKLPPVGTPKAAAPQGGLTGPAASIHQIISTWALYPEGVKKTLRDELKRLVDKL